MIVRCFKILDTKTGLYSKGGSYPRFGKVGKLWTSEGAVKSHLTLVGVIPSSWEVIEFTGISSGTQPAQKLHARPAKK